MLRLEGRGSDHLLFLPGFMAPAPSYIPLLRPVATAGVTVVIPQLYPRGITALRGKVSIATEARAAADLVAGLSGRVFVGGHSRGGQAAWLAAAAGGVEGVCLIDPVDGHARRPAAPASTARPAGFDCPSLIVGAGVPGPCAPPGADHEQFARATPGAAHIVVEDLGHADILDGRGRSLGRRLCRGGAQPDAARELCSRLVVDFIAGRLPPLGDGAGFRRVR